MWGVFEKVRGVKGHEEEGFCNSWKFFAKNKKQKTQLYIFQ